MFLSQQKGQPPANPLFLYSSTSRSTAPVTPSKWGCHRRPMLLGLVLLWIEFVIDPVSFLHSAGPPCRCFWWWRWQLHHQQHQQHQQQHVWFRAHSVWTGEWIAIFVVFPGFHICAPNTWLESWTQVLGLVTIRPGRTLAPKNSTKLLGLA